jgi:16S rRNA C967 or C1407 C5-methylase (RsmB/RsmF family)/NOL1/NOP2/fmu family ribosome biogenesis protein
MYPPEFIKRIESQKYIDADRLIRALGEPSPVSIRVNPAKWRREPVNALPVKWCKTGYYTDLRPAFTPDPLYHAGCYYPQEASGMFIEEVFRQVADKGNYLRVLDLCAAPGGKATHLASLIGPDGLLVANEAIKARASILSENISRWGAINTLVTQNDPSDFAEMPGFFDIILVDAPCSGEGMFRDRVAIKEWSVENAVLCSGRQKRILRNVWPALKENGILIYSTCTFNPAENEENASWLIRNGEAESVMLDISDFDNIVRIDHQGITGYGFYPDKIMGEGLFISVIRKKERVEVRKKRTRVRHNLRTVKEDLKALRDMTLLPDESLIRIGNEVLSIACGLEDFQYLGDYLRIVRMGTTVCKVKNREYLPVHDLAVSQGVRADAFGAAELDFKQAAAYLRRDELRLPGLRKGWLIVTYKGVNLGFINNIGHRINNYFPVNRRIRMNLLENAIESIIEWNE